MAELEGQSISEFEILSKLGQGGMGTVYLARQSSLNRNVAIKVLSAHLANDPTFIHRFRREATVAASLSHPDIVQVLAAGEHSGVHYIAMEYVNGEPLRTRLAREGRIAPAEALAIVVRVAQALNYAWQKTQLIHRDIKPGNILLSKEGSVKLADLGMVKCLADETNQLTSTGTALGTPYYTSPEQARSRTDIDFRADIYSLGCTLYQMLTGQMPYEGDDSLAILYKHVNDPPPDILKIMPDCPPGIVALLSKMLAKDRDHRHHSYDELIAEVYAAHDQIPQQSVSVPKRRSYHATYVAAACSVVIIVVGIFTWSPWKGRAASPIPTKLASHSEQRPRDAASTPHIEVVKTETATPPSPSGKPAGDALPSPKSESTTALDTKNNLPASSSPTTEAKPVAPTPTTTRLTASAAGDSGGSNATSSEQRRPTDMVTTATSIPSGTAVIPTTAETAKQAPPPTPTSSSTNQPSVTDTEIAFLKSIAALPPAHQVTQVMARLKDINPQFDGKETHKIENGAVTELAFSTVGVTDIRPLKALKWLKKLSIAPPGTNQKGALSDLSAVAGLPLTGLWCQGNPISDLSPLKDMPLTVLSCGSTQVKDLTPLTDMKLTVLSFNDTEADDLGPLDGMPLTVLWCNNTKVTDLSPLRAAPLQELRCDFVAERDAALLRGIKMLTKINDTPASVFWMRVGRVAARPPSTSSAQKDAPPAIALAPNGAEKTMTTATGIEMVWIPPGEFMMGSTPDEQQWALANGGKVDVIAFEGKKPRKTKIKNGFWLGRTEVTVAQWKRFVAATSYKSDAEHLGSADSAPIKGEFWGRVQGASWHDPRFSYPVKDDHPVCCITWNDAMAFCLWLTQTEEKIKKLPTDMICRLPTEAEWEYACRAGKRSAFWWGDDKMGGEKRLNWYGTADGFDYVSPADHYRVRGRNKFGLADMLGNVWEWCLDAFDPEGAHEERFKSGDRYVIRGGSFRDTPGAARCASRNWGYSRSTYAHYGFRLAIGIDQ